MSTGDRYSFCDFHFIGHEFVVVVVVFIQAFIQKGPVELISLLDKARNTLGTI